MRAQVEAKGHPSHGTWKRMTFAFYSQSISSLYSLMLQVAIPGIADLQLQMNVD